MKEISRKELIKEYLEFFQSKKHIIVPNSPLVPENDPTVLFTTAGMHPLVPFLLGEKHPLGKRLCNVQRCIRTQDIDSVGNTYHHTFFEMLGNWSLGDYFKRDAISFSFEFLTRVLKIPVERLAVTCFAGDKDASKDEESAEIWQSFGIKKERIAFLPKENNWWGPAGKIGPCGPDTEMFYWKPKSKAPAKFDPDDNKWVEIWNDVLMQYNKDESGNYNIAEQKNVDTGMGVERTITILSGLEDNYICSAFKPIIEKIESLSKKKYSKDKEETRAMRIIADHIKASVFIIADNVVPSNVEQGYVLRKLLRRAIVYGRKLGLKNFTAQVAEPVFSIYDDYDILKDKKKIIEELKKEEERFLLTLEKGLNIFNKMCERKEAICGKDCFLLFQSYGFPIEMTKEFAKEKNISIDEKAFDEEMKTHQELSRTAAEGKFKSGLADNSEATTRLHTATHLLNEALRRLVSNNIVQKGSNITAERLRFDFNFDRKLTPEELKKVEDEVNNVIQKAMPVERLEMSVEEAKKQGAQAMFSEKYTEKVSVYKIDNYSTEICTGPHVKNTSELGHFKIVKEESVAAGTRRIKAILE